MMALEINGLNVITIEDDGSKDNCKNCIFNSYCYDGLCPVLICESYADIKYHFVHSNPHIEHQLSNKE